jgi:hypothetical protein
MILEKTNLERLAENKIIDLAKFVVSENFKHHDQTVSPDEYLNDVADIYEEEIKYRNNSNVFVAKDNFGNISGSIRVLKWNYKDVLPIEKIFGINPTHITGNVLSTGVWHIGRFAINKKAGDLNLFKKLMVCAIAPICRNQDSIAFAECDSKLLRVLSLMGIQTTVIGESINYLGSETIPVCMNYDGLIGFYNKNKHLVTNNALISSKEEVALPESVIFQPQNINYSLV